MSLLRRVSDSVQGECTPDQLTQMMRRQFLTSSASGLGGLGLLSVLAQDGVTAEKEASQSAKLLGSTPPTA